MKKTLYLKCIIAYIIFGVFAFFLIGLLVPMIAQDTLKKERAEDLYTEAVLIADTYASGLYTNDTSLGAVKNQLDVLSVFINATSSRKRW